MSEPTIIVIPGEYYGGAVPKSVRPQSSPMQSGMAPARQVPDRKISPKLIVIIGVSVLFIAVVGFAAWYFTKPLRVPAPSPGFQPSSPSGRGENISPSAPAQEIVLPNPEVVQPIETPEPVVSAPVTPETPPAPEPFSDSDNDKLTFAEEGLYHTQPTIPDTDADGFIDGHEVINLYNPSGIAPEKLEAAGLVARAINTTHGYEVLYPKAWPAPQDTTAREISFGANGEAISASVIDNPGNVLLTEWAVQNFGGTFSAWTSNKAGLTGLFGRTEGGQRAAFSSRGLIYLFQYTPAAVEHPMYTTTFEMMLNSFKLTE